MPSSVDVPARRVLITGASGFLGRAVVDLLRGRPGVELFALSRVAGRVAPRGLTPLVGDLDDARSLTEVVTKVEPDGVIHLAGRTPPAPPDDLYLANTLGTLRLLDALKSLGRPVRLVAAGSAAELGPVPAEALPVGEDHPARPADAYGLSKLLATTAVLAARGPIEPIAARVFNPIGPGTPPSQAFGRFAAILAAAGPDPVDLVVGDLSPRRDFIDVRDVAAALVALLERGTPGSLLHLGAGASRSIGEGLETLIRLSGRTVRIRVDPGLAARPGPMDSRADVRRIAAATGWAPRIPFERSLADLWAAARSPLSSPSPAG